MVLFVLLTQRMSVSTDVVDANGAADDILNGNGDISLSGMLAEIDEDIEEDEAEGWGRFRRKGPCSRNWAMIKRDLLVPTPVRLAYRTVLISQLRVFVAQKPDCLATPKMLAGVRRMVPHAPAQSTFTMSLSCIVPRAVANAQGELRVI